ncbi:MAG: Outer membrane protein assembly factor BamD [Candidatus Scalindua rubra]|uniref:Outer membrane protein assembly factor BamD n=1 Tax=Candidatus Scalindua rubra TaxID=1872076 RepID=A0A1E3XFR5_9BACT|nr:MAG: Outer membrane protein assembly factor BamD [Candidatus Scalindua rubra]
MLTTTNHAVNETNLTKRKYIICDVIILILLEAFILSYLHPSLLIKDTIITGGDTASYFHPLKYLKETLLPSGRLVGWDHGNFAGYPLFQFYFVVPFLFAAILGYFIKITVALKIVTILGILMLPLFTYFSFRKLNYCFPVPVITAILTLVFLFQEGYTIWGGNILSTLAGEFCYSISLSVFVLYLGHLYRGINDDKGIVKNAFLLALCGLCHSFVFIIAGMLSFFFLFSGITSNLYLRKFLPLTNSLSRPTHIETEKDGRDKFIRKLKYVIKLNLLTFLLLGFWIIPFITKLNHTTSYYSIWQFHSWKELLSFSLLPFLILSIIRITLPRKVLKGNDKGRCTYLLYICFISIMLYCNAHLYQAPDIRFLPIFYLMTIFITADLMGCLVRYIRPRIVFTIMVLFGITFWIFNQGGRVENWAKWNYEGYESKVTWKTFEKINSFLKGEISDPRVAYEKTHAYKSFGSDRIFESLPLFSGRQTLEGIHFASSISSKHIVFLQTELSKDILAPILYVFSKVNIDALDKHLKMFNINHLLIVTEKIKNSLRKNTNFKEVFKLNKYSIFEFRGNTGNYVEIPKYLPVVFTGKDWRKQFYEWFKIPETLDVPLVPSSYIKSNDLKDFKSFSDNIHDIKRFMNDNLLLLRNKAKETSNFNKITETITPFEIKFVTPFKGMPHIIKVSYFPNWKVSGADRVYPVSPCFMLVIPNQNEVMLTYGRTPADIVGIILTLTGLIICVAALCGVWNNTVWTKSSVNAQSCKFWDFVYMVLRPCILIAAIIILAISTTYCLIYRNFPIKIYLKGTDFYDSGKYEDAIRTFQKITRDKKYDIVDVVLSMLFEARSYTHMNKYDDAIKTFQDIINTYPYSRYVAEAYYEIGLIYVKRDDIELARTAFKKAVEADEFSIYTKHAKNKLAELKKDS